MLLSLKQTKLTYRHKIYSISFHHSEHQITHQFCILTFRYFKIKHRFAAFPVTGSPQGNRIQEKFKKSEMTGSTWVNMLLPVVRFRELFTKTHNLAVRGKQCHCRLCAVVRFLRNARA